MLLFSLTPLYLGCLYFLNKDLFFKHQYFLIALFPEFFDKKFVLTLKEGLKLVLRFLIFTNLFLPSKILLHNGIRELSEYFFCLYTLFLALLCFICLFCGGFYTLFGLSYIFLLTETFLIGLLWEYSVLFRLYFSSLFPLNLDLNVVVRFYLGNPSSSAVRGGISLGTFALVGGGLCFQWARECTNCIVAGDLFMENSLVEVKAKIEAYNVKLEQIEVKRIKNFDHFLNKGSSLDEAYSKAATITHEEYGEASKSIPETLSELVKLKGDVMDATLKKQPIQRFLESYELKATADFSIKAKK